MNMYMHMHVLVTYYSILHVHVLYLAVHADLSDVEHCVSTERGKKRNEVL